MSFSLTHCSQSATRTYSHSHTHSHTHSLTPPNPSSSSTVSPHGFLHCSQGPSKPLPQAVTEITLRCKPARIPPSLNNPVCGTNSEALSVADTPPGPTQRSVLTPPASLLSGRASHTSHIKELLHRALPCAQKALSSTLSLQPYNLHGPCRSPPHLCFPLLTTREGGSQRTLPQSPPDLLQNIDTWLCKDASLTANHAHLTGIPQE